MISAEVIERPPPGAQAAFERYSITFFTRPNDSVILRALKEKSDLIFAAAAKAPEGQFETGSTAAEWVRRRIRKLRLMNRKVGRFYICRRVRHI